MQTSNPTNVYNTIGIKKIVIKGIAFYMDRQNNIYKLYDGKYEILNHNQWVIIRRYRSIGESYYRDSRRNVYQLIIKRE